MSKIDATYVSWGKLNNDNNNNNNDDDDDDDDNNNNNNNTNTNNDNNNNNNNDNDNKPPLVASLQWRHNERHGVSMVCSTVCSCADQRKHQSSTSLALWGEFTGDHWIPRTKGQQSFHLMTKLRRFDVIMTLLRHVFRGLLVGSFSHNDSTLCRRAPRIPRDKY